MYKYRSAAINGLAVQLRRGPMRLRLRQLSGIEFVLSVVEDEKKYPFDFVQHALTGFRSPNGNGHSPAATPLIRGELIRDDLINLAEDLSGQAEISAERWTGRVSTVSELASRFDVSTKTIFRWHRRGLIGWRLRFADRRLRLAFPEHCIRRFVAGHIDLVSRGRSFSQLSRRERDTIIARAAELVGAGDQTVNAVAKIISKDAGRAVETIRLILKSYDEAHPQTGIFNRSSLYVPPDDRRLKIWEAHVDGASVASLAKRFAATPREIYKTVTQMRARELKSRPIEFMDSEDFRAPAMIDEIMNSPHLAAAPNEATPERRIPPDLPPYLQQLFRVPLLNREQELALFRKMNFLRCQAEQARDAIDPDTATAQALDAIEQLVAQAEELKSRITQANLRLVVSIAKRHVRPKQDFFELVSDGNVSLMRAVDRFDYSRGFKFSTYASWAIIKNFARSLPGQRLHNDRYQTGREELLERCAGPQLDEHENDFLRAARAKISDMLETLDDRDREIVRQRYGLDGRGEPRTLEQIGKHFGISKERIRQLEARAIGRLRTDFETDLKSLIGA